MEGLFYAAELFKNEGDGGIEGAKTAETRQRRIAAAITALREGRA
jgi:hypothetical protein